MVMLSMRHAVDMRDSAIVGAKATGRRSLQRALASEAALDDALRGQALTDEAQAAGAVGTFDIDIGTDTLRPSATFCQIFGLPAAASYPASMLETIVQPLDADVFSRRESRADGSAAREVEYRIRRAHDGALRWIARRAEFIRDDGGAIVRFSGIVQDVTDRKGAEDRQSALLALGDALRDASDARRVFDLAAACLGETLLAGRAGCASIGAKAAGLQIRSEWTGDLQALPPDVDPAQFPETVRRLVGGEAVVAASVANAAWLASDLPGYRAIGAQSAINVPVLVHGDLVAAMFVHAGVDRAWTKGEIDFVYAVADRAYAAIAKIQAEDDQQLLNEELSHRVKNTMAMVQAIARQTLTGTTEKPAFERFNQRLIALSAAHDILLAKNWARASVEAVVRSGIAVQGAGKQVTVSGDDVEIGPRSAMSLGLIVHELTTNAMKHGALATPSGSVSVRWSVQRVERDPVLTLHWRESGGQTAQKPSRRGFGSRLIDLGIAGTRGATVHYTPHGIVAVFVTPLGVLKL